MFLLISFWKDMHKKSNDRHKIDTNHETVLYWTIQFVGEGDPFLDMQR